MGFGAHPLVSHGYNGPVNRSDARLLGRTAFAAAVLAIAIGCTDGNATGVQTSATDPVPGLAENAPATPAAKSEPTPLPSDASGFATPVPPPAPATAPPSPTQPLSTPGDATSTVALPSPIPSGYRKTNVPTDLAVSGPAYFVLSTRPDPAGLEDLIFTRDGHFKLVAETDNGLNHEWLRHDPDGFNVVAYVRENAGASAPDERSGTGDALLATTWQGTAVQATSLALDADRNPDLLAKVAFDYTGRLAIGGADPRASDGQPQATLVTLAQFADPAQLAPLAGFAGMFRYQAAAGTMTLGVAVSGPGRTLGNANLLLAGSLEGS